MIQRDFVLRQIQQLVQALAYVLQLKSIGKSDEAIEAVDNGLREAFGDHFANFEEMTAEDLLAWCARDGVLNAELAFALAEMLEEKGNLLIDGPVADSRHFYKLSLSLYKALILSGNAVPFDIHERIERLEAMA